MVASFELLSFALQLQRENKLYKSSVVVTSGANQVSGSAFLFSCIVFFFK